MPISAGTPVGSAAIDAAGGSIAFNTTAIVPAGAMLIVGVGCQGITGLTATATDNSGQGNTYAQDLFVPGGAVTQTVGIFHLIASLDLPSGTTITCSFSGGTPADRRIAGLYYTGQGSGLSLLDGTPDAATGTSTTPTSPTHTAAEAGELYLGICTFQTGGGDFTAGTGYTRVHHYNDTGRHFAIEEDVTGNTAGQSVTATGTITSAQWRMGIALYKAAPSGINPPQALATADMFVPSVNTSTIAEPASATATAMPATIVTDVRLPIHDRAAMVIFGNNSSTIGFWTVEPGE